MNRTSKLRRTALLPFLVAVSTAVVVAGCAPAPPGPDSVHEPALARTEPNVAPEPLESSDAPTTSVVELEDDSVPGPDEQLASTEASDDEASDDAGPAAGETEVESPEQIASPDSEEAPINGATTVPRSVPPGEAATEDDPVPPASLSSSSSSSSSSSERARALAPPVQSAARRAAAESVVLDVGHVDLIEVTVDGDRLVVSVKDDTSPSGVVFRSPEAVQLRVPDAARVPVPSGPFSFLGAEGAMIYLLPQVQDPTLVWPGWSTERMSAGQVVGDAVSIRLTNVDGPGQVTLFTTDQFGTPTVLINSAGGPDQIQVPIRTHAHANWTFSAAGVYRLTFEVAATVPGGAPTSTTATYAVLVGDAAQPLPPGSVEPPRSGAPSAGAAIGSATPGEGPGGVGGPAGAVDGASGAGGAAAAGGAGAAGAGSTNRTGAAGSLARTGAETNDLVAGSALLLLLGAALSITGATRRRVRRAT